MKKIIKKSLNFLDYIFFPSNGAEVWSFAAIGIWIYVMVSFFVGGIYEIFFDFNPLNPVGYPTIYNPNYDPSLGQVFIEECWTEGHPAFGDVVCDSVDKNPQYIQDPIATTNRMIFFIFIFLLIFLIARIFHYQKYETVNQQSDINNYKLKKLQKKIYKLKSPTKGFDKTSSKDILLFLTNNIQKIKEEDSDPKYHQPYDTEYIVAFHVFFSEALLEMRKRTNDDFYVLFLDWDNSNVRGLKFTCYTYWDFDERFKLYEEKY